MTSSTHWVVPVEDFTPYNTTVSVVVPPVDTGWVFVTMSPSGEKAAIWLWADSEGMKFQYGHPRTFGWHPGGEEPPTFAERQIAAGDPEELRQVREVFVSLKGSHRFTIAKMVELYGDKMRPIEGYGDSVFVVTDTLRRLWLMTDHGAYFIFALPPKVPQLRPKESPKTAPIEEDSTESGDSSSSKGDGSVYLIGVDGQAQAGYLPADDTLTIYLGIENNTGDWIKGMANGFRIYSPDGAQYGCDLVTHRDHNGTAPALG